MSVVLVETSDRVGHITLNRPEALNAITVDLGAELGAALRSLGARDDISVIAVRGAGGNFSAGGDFAEVQRLRAGGAEALRPLFENFRDACAAVAEVAQPVVAIVEGVAMAGGFEFVCSADIVLVRDDARLCDNHINFGQIPGGGGTQRLAPLVGRQRALGHLLSGERLSGAQAVEWGIAFRSYAAEDFEAGVSGFLATMAGRHPGALAQIKSLTRYGQGAGLEAGLDAELAAVIDHIGGEAGGAGVAQFQGRGSAS